MVVCTVRSIGLGLLSVISSLLGGDVLKVHCHEQQRALQQRCHDV